MTDLGHSTLICDPRASLLRKFRVLYLLLFFGTPVFLGVLVRLKSPYGVSDQAAAGVYLVSHLFCAVWTAWFAKKAQVSLSSILAYSFVAAVPLPILSWIVLISLWRRSSRLISEYNVDRHHPNEHMSEAKRSLANLFVEFLNRPRKVLAALLVWTTVNLGFWLFFGKGMSGFFPFSSYNNDFFNPNIYGRQEFFVYGILPWVGFAVFTLLKKA